MPHEPLIFGSFEIVPLCDGWTALPLAEEVPGHDVDWDDERRRFPWAFPPDVATGWAWHVHAFLVRTPDGPGARRYGHRTPGPPRYDVTGRIDDELQASVCHPTTSSMSSIRISMPTTRGARVVPDGTPRFPNARYHVHPDDWAFFGERRTPAAFTGRFAMAGARGSWDAGPRPLGPRGRTRRSRGACARPHAGPPRRGHRWRGRGRTLLLAGDLLHVPPQVVHPDLDVGPRRGPRAASEAPPTVDRGLRDASAGSSASPTSAGRSVALDADGWSSI